MRVIVTMFENVQKKTVLKYFQVKQQK